MLKITIPSQELFDDTKGEFVYVKETVLQLEHSLISVSKWESKWHKAFLNTPKKTAEETVDYVRCMCLNPVQDPSVINYMTRQNIEEVQKYINDPMSSTHFLDEAEDKNKAKTYGRPQTDVVTSELIYYWMISLNIPFECQKWHLNRLLSLIKVCNIKNAASMGKGKKISRSDLAARNTSLNEARRKALKTTG